MTVFCELGTLFPHSIFNSQDYNGLFQKKCSDISRKIELGQNENSLNFFFFGNIFHDNVLPFVIEEQSYWPKLFWEREPPKYGKCVQSSHIVKVFLYLYVMNTGKEVILQICLLQFFTAEILRHVPNITNPNTVNTRHQKLHGSSGTGKHDHCCCGWHLMQS